MVSRNPSYDPTDYPLTYPMFVTTQQWVGTLEGLSDVQWVMMRQQLMEANVEIMQNMIDVMRTMEEALNEQDE